MQNSKIISLATVDDVKERWTKIREKYNKYKHRSKNRSGSARRNTKTYHLAPSLQFLDPVLRQSRLVELKLKFYLYIV